MAGARTCRSPYRNPPSDGKDELARGPLGAPNKDSNTFTPFPLVSRAQTPAPVPVLPSALVSSFIKKLCQQLLKTYVATVKLLEKNHGSGP